LVKKGSLEKARVLVWSGALGAVYDISNAAHGRAAGMYRSQQGSLFGKVFDRDRLQGYGRQAIMKS